MDSSDDDGDPNQRTGADDVFNEYDESNMSINNIDDELEALTFERSKVDYQYRKYGQEPIES